MPHSLRLRLDIVEASLKDPKRFGEGLAILQSQEFQKKDIKRVFNAYSDNIYYLVSAFSHPALVYGALIANHRMCEAFR